MSDHVSFELDGVEVTVEPAPWETLLTVLRERLGVTLKNLDAPTESLSGGQRQAVAIARAVHHTDLKVLVMDEPTAALGPQETARTLKLIETLKHQGLAIILISHSLDDVFAI